MSQPNAPPGMGDWWPRFLADSLMDIQRGLGQLTGEVRSLKEEAIGRVIRLEQRMLDQERRKEASWLPPLKEWPWRHIVGVPALIILGLMGHAGIPEWKQLLGLKP